MLPNLLDLDLICRLQYFGLVDKRRNECEHLNVTECVILKMPVVYAILKDGFKCGTTH